MAENMAYDHFLLTASATEDDTEHSVRLSQDLWSMPPEIIVDNARPDEDNPQPGDVRVPPGTMNAIKTDAEVKETEELIANITSVLRPKFEWRDAGNQENKKLIEKLDDDDYYEREAAQKSLTKKGIDAIAEVVAALDQDNSPEQNWRLKQFLKDLKSDVDSRMLPSTEDIYGEVSSVLVRLTGVRGGEKAADGLRDKIDVLDKYDQEPALLKRRVQELALMLDLNQKQVLELSQEERLRILAELTELDSVKYHRALTRVQLAHEDPANAAKLLKQAMRLDQGVMSDSLFFRVAIELGLEEELSREYKRTGGNEIFFKVALDAVREQMRKEEEMWREAQRVLAEEVKN